MEIVRPSDIFEPLVGHEKRVTEVIDFNPRAVRVLMRLLSAQKDWMTTIVPSQVPKRISSQLQTVLQSVCIVKTTKYWVTIAFGLNNTTGMVEVSELIIFNPLGNPQDNEGAKELERLTCIEIDKYYPLAKEGELVSCS